MSTHEPTERLRARFDGRMSLARKATQRQIANARLANLARYERKQLELIRKGQPTNASLGAGAKISVTIPTYNRGELLVNRTLPSVLGQKAVNLEVIVVGDCCVDATSDLVEGLGDPRVRFINLSQRGQYPTDPLKRWMVAGATPINIALEAATGDWLMYMDDDDILSDGYMSKAIAHALATDAELVFGRTETELAPGVWETVDQERFPDGHPPFRDIGHSGVLYRSYLRFMKYHDDSWKSYLPTDSFLWQRMGRIGVRAVRISELASTMPLRPGESQLTLATAIADRNDRG